MSGVAVIRTLLAQSAALLAVADATKIFAGDARKGATAPLVSVKQISGTERHTVAMTGVKLRIERVQVTVNGRTYPEQKQLLELARLACPNRSGVIDGITVDSILPAGEGPDGYDPITLEYSQSRDFFVKWKG